MEDGRGTEDVPHPPGLIGRVGESPQRPLLPPVGEGGDVGVSHHTDLVAVPGDVDDQWKGTLLLGVWLEAWSASQGQREDGGEGVELAGVSHEGVGGGVTEGNERHHSVAVRYQDDLPGLERGHAHGMERGLTTSVLEWGQKA